MLYEVMLGLAGKNIILEDILDFSGLTEGQFRMARKKLEQYLLLTTYTDDAESRYEFWMHAPKSAEEFLRHDIFGRLIINNVSSGRYERIRQLFVSQEEPHGLKNVSDILKARELETGWTEQKETMLQSYIPAASDLKNYPFDWNLFYQGMRRSIPPRLRTRENQSRIAYLANMYGISEEDMRRYVIRGITSERASIDFDVIQDLLTASTKTQAGTGDPLKDSPVQYLQEHLPNGEKVLESEKKLVMDLSQTYGFGFDVINLLIQYCMDQCDQSVNEKYVKKVAASWWRKGISTAAKAQAEIERSKQYKSGDAPMPDWYYQSKEANEKPDEDLLAEILALEQEE